MDTGRIGSIVMPFAGGALLAANWPAQTLILIAAVPILLSAVAFATLASRTSPLEHGVVA